MDYAEHINNSLSCINCSATYILSIFYERRQIYIFILVLAHRLKSQHFYFSILFCSFPSPLSFFSCSSSFSFCFIVKKLQQLISPSISYCLLRKTFYKKRKAEAAIFDLRIFIFLFSSLTSKSSPFSIL